MIGGKLFKGFLRKSRLLQLAGRLGQCRFIILMYHGVSASRRHPGICNHLGLHVPVEDFLSQMQYLSRSYPVIPLSEMVERLGCGWNRRGSYVSITFDDGYRNNYTNAYPVLKKLKLPATFFVTVEPLESGEPLWFDMIENVINRTAKSNFTAPMLDMELDLSTTEKRKVADRILKSHAKKLRRPERSSFIEELARRCGVVDKAYHEDYLPMAWDELREISSEQFGIGLHSLDHGSLMTMDPEEAGREISLAKSILEERLGRGVDFFAYPFGESGDYDERLKEVCREIGFSCALASGFAFNRPGSDLFELKRFGIEASCSLTKFASIVSGLESFAVEARKRTHIGGSLGTSLMRV